MKVTFITREGYNLPGARIRCYNFARELSKCGAETEVLSFSDNLGAKDGEKESQMGLKDKLRLNYLGLKKLLKKKGNILYMQRFNYHSFAPFLAHLINKNRIVLDLDDWEMREDPKYYLHGLYPSSKAHYFTRLIAKRSIFCIAASRFLEKFLLQFNSKVYYLPSGVDTELFKSSSNGLPADKVTISWIGTFHRKEYIENIEFFMDCFSVLRKKHPHIYFEIYGDGIYKRDLERIISRFNDRHILLRGWIRPQEVPACLCGIHIGVLPVAGRTKFNLAKSPTKLFEYMAMAKPTVSSAIGEAAGIIKDGENGLLADSRERFIEKLDFLIENPQARSRIGKKARESVEKNYSLYVLGEQLYRILQKS